MKFPSEIYAVIFQDRIRNIRHSARTAARCARAIRYENHLPKTDRTLVQIRRYILVKEEPIDSNPDSTTA